MSDQLVLDQPINGEAIVLQHPEQHLAMSRPPDVVLEEARKAARCLTDVLEAKKKKVMFNGEQYLEYEDWQTCARFYGMTAMSGEPQYVEFGEGEDKVSGFRAEAKVLLISTNQVVSTATSFCMNDEANWAKKPLFQLSSMAQTRACAKALRNVLAWIVVLAGYKPTPYEEMPQESNPKASIEAPKKKGKGLSDAQLRMLRVKAENGNVTWEAVTGYVKTKFDCLIADMSNEQMNQVLEWLQPKE